MHAHSLQTHRAGKAATVDRSAALTQAGEFDALVIPGGYPPDHLRLDRGVVDLVRRFTASGRPVAAVCHGPQLLIEADAVRGRTLTSWPSVRTGLENAGARWVDRQVVEDGNLITSLPEGAGRTSEIRAVGQLRTLVRTTPMPRHPTHQSGLLMFSVKDENMTLKLTLILSRSLALGST